MIEPMTQAYLFREVLGNGATFVFWHAFVVKGELDILDNAELLDQIIALKNEAQIAATGLREVIVIKLGNIQSTKEILAARGLIKTAENVQHRGLATA